MQKRNRFTAIENELVSNTGEGEGGGANQG